MAELVKKGEPPMHLCENEVFKAGEQRQGEVVRCSCGKFWKYSLGEGNYYQVADAEGNPLPEYRPHREPSGFAKFARSIFG